MPIYLVKAKLFGDIVYFEVEAKDTAEALETARKEAGRIFKPLMESPTVEVKEKK